jgi:hypothetical protein
MRVLFFVISLFASVVGAQEVSLQAREKAEPEVLARALAGSSQLAMVTLDATEAVAKADAARVARGLPFYDRTIMEELSRSLDNLKASVFPEGRMGSVVLLNGTQHYHPHVEVVTVSLPNFNSLMELVQHPRVKFVHDYYKTFSPAGRAGVGDAGVRE